MPLDSADVVAHLLSLCPVHKPTPLLSLPDLAARCGIRELWVKDERSRMGLGSFKALGAAYAIAREASNAQHAKDDWTNALAGKCYVTASAGNHGMSVAAGARAFGAQAVVYLAETVPEAFAGRLRAKGAQVVRSGETYEDSMTAAEAAARENGWLLLSDSSWPSYTEMPLRVMEGYLQLASEVASEMAEPPSHILLQAGVGGLAAAVAAHARKIWGNGPVVIVVEPEAAPALMESIRAGNITTAPGPVSSMGRLDCKTPSMIALNGLARDANFFMTVTEEEAHKAVSILNEHSLATTPSGAAGIAALVAGLPGIDSNSKILAIVSEGTEDG